MPTEEVGAHCKSYNLHFCSLSSTCQQIKSLLISLFSFPNGPLRPPQNDPQHRSWWKIPFSEWSRRTIEEVKAGFQLRGAESKWTEKGIPDVCGALDGSHIQIEPPRGQQQEDYRNYKKFHSIHLQGVADSEYCLINIFIGCAGGNHDSTVYNFSDLSKHLLTPEGVQSLAGGYLVADAAYSASKTVVTPYPGSDLVEMKEKFNHVHSSTRMAIEQTFGILKNMWRVLMYKIDSRILKKLVTVVTAICILHNMGQVHNTVRNRRRRVRVPESERAREQRRTAFLDSVTANARPPPQVSRIPGIDEADALRNSIAINL
jgi:hypothetical protein